MRGHFDAGLHELRASVLCALGQHEEALQDLDRIIERFPGNGDARVGRITILRMLGRVTDAASELEALLSNPGLEKEVGLWFLLGELYRDAGQLEQAERTFTRCLDDDKEFVAARISRALVRIKLDRAADAVSDLSEAIRELPYASEMYVDRAIAYRTLGSRRESMSDLEHALDNDASSARAHRESARWLAEEDARQAIQHAIIACDAMKGWDESLPVLLEVGERTNCRHWTAEFPEQFVARLPQADQEPWRESVSRLRDEAAQQGPDAVSPELAVNARSCSAGTNDA
jgi:tetratricopeptide (TPR) repeat protein